MTVGAYQLVDVLGLGRLATVFKAYHAPLDRFVALKMLRADVEHGPELSRRFQEVARRVARLEHPNIVPIHDLGEHDGRAYLVMKYVEGESLEARLGRGPLAVAEASRLAGAVGAALTYAHEHELTHGALKPSNILLANAGGIYVCDFGASHIRLGLGDEARVGAGPGGRGQPPEQDDPRSDQYALGLLLFEALTGVAPFSGLEEDLPGLVPLGGRAPRPSALNPALSEAVDQVLLRALEHEPAQRYPDVRAMALDFQRVTAPPRPASAPLPTAEIAEPFARDIQGPGAEPRNRSGEAPAMTLMLAMPGGHIFRLRGRTVYYIGRSDPARSQPPDLDLSEWHGVDLGVSRQHARLHVDRGLVFFTDLKSTNGSSVNGVRLYPGIPMQVQDGDELGLGKVTFRLYFGTGGA
jgi:serine/threonine protein kinase